MQVDGMPPEGQFSRPESRMRHAHHASWHGPPRSQYPELDDRGQPVATWGQQILHDIHNVGFHVREAPRPMNMGPPTASMLGPQQNQHVHQDVTELQPAMKNRRQAWYNGPPQAARTSPEDSSSSDGIPTPGMTAVEVNPMIMHSSGFVEAQHAGMHPDGHQNVSMFPKFYGESLWLTIATGLPCAVAVH
jgi:hypothetical protein